MTTIVQAQIPADEFALGETLQQLPAASFECEHVVERSDSTVMPLVWGRHASQQELEDVLDHDSSISEYTRLANVEDSYLYRMEWTTNIELTLEILTTPEAVILDANGTADGWYLRILFPDRDNVSSTTEFCDRHELSFDITSIREIDGPTETDTRFGPRLSLTPTQYEALQLAYKRGYFSVPRDIDLDELSEEMDISHQALSERLRRAHHAVIEDLVIMRPEEEATDK
jgi:predicted DNA binding protein